MAALEKQHVEPLIREHGNLPVWAVISTFALESLHEGLTYQEAERQAHKERVREPDRSATIVLVIEHLKEIPL